MKTNFLDTRLGEYKWYRKLTSGKWYLHKFTKDAEQLNFVEGSVFWARYSKINRYSDVIYSEQY